MYVSASGPVVLSCLTSAKNPTASVPVVGTLCCDISVRISDRSTKSCKCRATSLVVHTCVYSQQGGQSRGRDRTGRRLSALPTVSKQGSWPNRAAAFPQRGRVIREVGNRRHTFAINSFSSATTLGSAEPLLSSL